MMDFGDREFPGVGNGFGWRRRMQNIGNTSVMPDFNTLPMAMGGNKWSSPMSPTDEINKAWSAYGGGGAMPLLGNLRFAQPGQNPNLRVYRSPGYQMDAPPPSFGTLPLSPMQNTRPRDTAMLAPRMRGM